MDENDEDSDSTVIISEISKNPEKVARKRRKLDARARKILHANINATNGQVISTDIKQDRNNDTGIMAERINQYLNDCGQHAASNNNDRVLEEIKVKMKLLKQENYSEERESLGDEVRVKEVVVISDESDDDFTIVDDTEKRFDKNTNLLPKIGVLTPSAINNRRATLDSEKKDTTLNISKSEKSANLEKINSKLTVLKPSAINSRRATISSFERNEASNNSKHVDFCNIASKNKEGNDNKEKDTVNKQKSKSNELSRRKSYGEHPTKLTTPNRNDIAPKKNSDTIYRKIKNSQAENIILSSKSTDISMKDIATVSEKSHQHISIHSSSVIRSTADAIAKNVLEISENHEKVDSGAVTVNTISTDHDNTALKNAMHNVCKDTSVTDIDTNKKINCNVIKSQDASNRVMDQTVNFGETPIVAGAIAGSKKGNVDLTNRRKSTDAKRIIVDKNELHTNISDSNLITLENPILQQLPNVSMSGDSSRVSDEIQTPSKDALCSNTEGHNDKSETSVSDVLKKILEKDNGNQTEIGECSKSVKNVSKVNLEKSKRQVNDQQGISDDRRENSFDKCATEFLISFFKVVDVYLDEIFLDSKLASKLRETKNILKKEIKYILRHIEKYGASKVRYACPKCSQLSVYSPEAVDPTGDGENPTLKHNVMLKCKSCRGLQILHKAHMQNTNAKQNDELNKSETRPEDTSELPSSDNSNVVINKSISAPAKCNPGTSKTNMNITYDKIEDSIVVDSLATDATCVDNIPAEVSGDNTSNQTSWESNPMVPNEKDEIKSGNVKTKTYKRRVDNNVSPINSKRVKADSREESAKVVKNDCNYEANLSSTTDNSASSLDAPKKLDNTVNKLIGNMDTTCNKNDLPRNYHKPKSREENKAQLTETLVGCFTKFQTKENYENTETVNVHACPECTCFFDCYTSLIEHMKDNHNIAEQLHIITCPLCNARLNEYNYMAHVKVHFPDENTDNVDNEIVTKINNCDVNTTDSAVQQQNVVKVAKPSEGKQYKCKICKEVLYSLCASKKHRKTVHGHLDLKNKKLFNVTDQKAVLKSDQSSARLKNASSENKNTALGNQEESTNSVTDSFGSCAINQREEIGNNKINKDVEYKCSDNESNIHNNTKQINLTQNYTEDNDDQNKSKQDRKRKNSEKMNIIQEAKRANLIESCEENKINYNENERNSSRSNTTDHAKDDTRTDVVIKLHETDKDIGNDKQSNIANNNSNSPENAEMISEPLHTSNTQDTSAVAKSTCQGETNEAESERIDIDMEDAEDSNKESKSKDLFSENNTMNESKASGVSSQHIDDRSFTQGEDVISGEQNKSKCIFPSTSGSKPTLANCYNCRTNIDLNDMNNHHCRQKIVGTLYNCFLCGVSMLQDDTHKCENENNFSIENVQITNVVTVKQVYVFKCEDCNIATDVYDDVIGHCQNHYNHKNDPTTFCKICQLSYHKNYFENHKHLHGKDVKTTNYSYKSLFTNWDKTFEDMPSHVLEEMQERSIYKSLCIKLRVINDGPWKYALYQCNQCETCVAPEKLEQHCLKECYFIDHPCSECNKLFNLYSMCENHELEHKKTKAFKIIEFNCKKDEPFNSKLFEARKIEILSRIPIVDIFKCICGVCFISNDSLKKHFVVCNLEDKGVLCPRCAVPRLFAVNDLEEHLTNHHGALAYRFRINSIVIQQDIETGHILNEDVIRTEGDDDRES